MPMNGSLMILGLNEQLFQSLVGMTGREKNLEQEKDVDGAESLIGLLERIQRLQQFHLGLG